MTVVEWKESLSVGVPILDQHHQHLIELINRLHGVIYEDGDVAVVEKIIENLVDYAKYHFEEEEKYLVSISFPDFDAHKARHNFFAVRMAQYLKEFRFSKRESVGSELFLFLTSWLVEHITVEDAVYADLLRDASKRAKQVAGHR